jgi:hypothetical protein
VHSPDREGEQVEQGARLCLEHLTELRGWDHDRDHVGYRNDRRRSPCTVDAPELADQVANTTMQNDGLAFRRLSHDIDLAPFD